MKLRVYAAIGLAALAIGPGAAFGSTKVVGNGMASTCANEALAGRFDRATLEMCNRAIENEFLPRDDAAKTYVNRGVVHLRRMDYERAERDFASAERLASDLPEVFINRGALRIRQRRYEESVAEINKGLALKPSEPEKAYFDRALAREALDDIKGAYLDYMKAVELRPDWQDPKTQLLRFTAQRLPVSGK